MLVYVKIAGKIKPEKYDAQQRTDKRTDYN